MDPSCTTLGSTFPDQRNPERTRIGEREFVASPLPRGQEQAQGSSHWPAGKSLKSLAPDSKAQLREFGSAIRLIV